MSKFFSLTVVWKNWLLDAVLQASNALLPNTGEWLMLPLVLVLWRLTDVCLWCSDCWEGWVWTQAEGAGEGLHAYRDQAVPGRWRSSSRGCGRLPRWISWCRSSWSFWWRIQRSNHWRSRLKRQPAGHTFRRISMSAQKMIVNLHKTS